ncbi:PAS domain S-box-containing protein [Hoeflea marina]|uniref:Blue-light-activated histidine kinase n=1 Tax=Hoeflea marina TaxID=274592 RepID=A0A317PHP2_9HYPH|nr:sensor histidine kinase [Hoeflea marina]PWV99102.1 PAS domain S-box-containing protein [Hoeflea marina]
MDSMRGRTTSFFAGGGEMGALMRARDWSATELGSPERWPQSLRTSIRILLSSQHPMFIWWGPDLIQFYNDAYRQTLGPERHPAALGQRGRDCWAEIWDIIGPQIEHVMRGEGSTWNEDQLVPVTRHGRREDVWWTYGYSPIDDDTAPGGVGGVLVVCNDVTDRHTAFEALKASEERLRLAVSAGSIGTWDWNLQTDRLMFDAAFAQMFGAARQDESGMGGVEQLLEGVHGDDREQLGARIRQAIDAGEQFHAEYRIVLADGSVRWVSARGMCHRDEDGLPTRFVGAAMDMTDRKQAELHRQLLTQEMDHRVKNMLARVQAIVNQTLRDGVDLAEGRDKIAARLSALSRAQDILTGRQLAGVDLPTVIAAVTESLHGEQFSVDGPEITLSPRVSQSFMMAFHELATNAVKYGALSNPDGHVSIDWSVTATAGSREFKLNWRETGGPAVRKPTATGFGTRLINKLLSAELRARAVIDYDPAGLVWTISAPLDSLRDAQE